MTNETPSAELLLWGYTIVEQGDSRNPRKSLRLSFVVNPVEHENSSRQGAESSSI